MDTSVLPCVPCGKDFAFSRRALCVSAVNKLYSTRSCVYTDERHDASPATSKRDETSLGSARVKL